MDGHNKAFYTDCVSDNDQIYAKGSQGCRHPLVTVSAGNTFFCMVCYENTYMYLITDPYIQNLMKDVTAGRDVSVAAEVVHNTATNTEDMPNPFNLCDAGDVTGK